MAYAYPQGDAGHARSACGGACKLVRTRAEALAHIQNTVSQYNLPPLAKKLTFAANREGVAEQFADASVRRMVESDLALIGHLDEQLQSLELYLVRHAKVDDPQAYHLLQTIPGVGKMLALVLLYEMHDTAASAISGTSSPTAGWCGRSHEIGRQEVGRQGAQDRQRPSAVGLRRSGLPDAAGSAGGPNLRRPHGEAARQGQGHFDPGGADRPHRLADAQTKGSVRCEPVPEIASVRRRRVSRAPNWATVGRA